MSRNTIDRQRDGNWGEIHDRLSTADAERRALLDAEIKRGPRHCHGCGAQLTSMSVGGYCYRAPCKAESGRLEYQRKRAQGMSREDARS